MRLPIIFLLLIPGVALAQTNQSPWQPTDALNLTEKLEWQTESSLLDVDQAFIPEASINADSEVELKWFIADGYYLYQERFSFEAPAADIALGTPRFPEGEMYSDEFFGNTEIHRQQVIVTIPWQATSTKPASLELEMVYQGCADVGVCFPPQTRRLAVAVDTSEEAP